ncbi:MAG: MarR family transcriptional regulator [Azoarcus sp.]|jgi:DNA-binding MarR family transcriptional regulator/predicted nucleic acid-binding protein/antitoxin component of MazEF toxin-antitoxin module|nr:MarR family transcriptional regulator [Azoarcus sp.]
MMRVLRWEDRLAVCLPAAVVDALKITEGEEITIEAGHGRALNLRLSPAAETAAALQRLRGFRGRLPASTPMANDGAIPARAFFDASILLGLLSANTKKAQHAEAILLSGISSASALDEAAHFMTSTLGMADEESGHFIELVSNLGEFVCPGPQIHADARRLIRAYGIEPAHALDIAIALDAGCDTCYTEKEISHWPTELHLTIRNPFANQEPNPPEPVQKRRLRSLYTRPGFLLRRAHQISAAIFENQTADIELTPGLFSILTVLSGHPGIDQSTLARAIGLDKVTISLLLRALEKRGLVARTPAQENRRSLAIRLTPAGVHLLEQAEPRIDVAYRQLTAPLTPQQLRQLMLLLDTLNTALDQFARTEFRPLAD